MISTRVVVLVLLIAALSLYAAYSANIVANIQRTSDSIQTISDLMHSPLKIGIHDIVYNRYYFKVCHFINFYITSFFKQLIL